MNVRDCCTALLVCRARLPMARVAVVQLPLHFTPVSAVGIGVNTLVVRVVVIEMLRGSSAAPITLVESGSVLLVSISCAPSPHGFQFSRRWLAPMYCYHLPLLPAGRLAALFPTSVNGLVSVLHNSRVCT